MLYKYTFYNFKICTSVILSPFDVNFESFVDGHENIFLSEVYDDCQIENYNYKLSLISLTLADEVLGNLLELFVGIPVSELDFLPVEKNFLNDEYWL